MTTTRYISHQPGDSCAPTPIEEIEIMTNTTAHTIKIDTTDIPVVGPDYTALVAAYTVADAGTKTKIRNAVRTAMEKSVSALDIDSAKTYMSAQESLKTVSAKTPEKVDYNRVVANRVHALRIAADLIMSGDATPDGVPTDEMDLDAIVAMVESPTAHDESIFEAARRIAGTKITKSVDRSDIAEMIMTAVRAVPVKTILTVAMIQKASGAPSGGAIAARLWPVTTKNGQKVATPTTLDLTAMGIELTTNESGVRAVRKIADVAATDDAN